MQRPRVLKRKIQTLHLQNQVSSILTGSKILNSAKPNVRVRRSVAPNLRNTSQVVHKKRSIKSLKVPQDLLVNDLISQSSTTILPKTSLIQYTERETDNQLEISYLDLVSGQTIRAWQSPFRPTVKTVFFPYPETLGCQRETKGLIEIPRVKLRYKIHGQVAFKCLLAAFEAGGFEQTEDDNWNIYWGLANKETLKEMKKNQKTNHFPGCWFIGRKDNLWIHLSRMKRKFPKDYNFIPNTYLLQYDFDRFEAIREQADKKQLWIKKPVAAARGNGIKVINKNSSLKEDSKYLVMDYISNPHLINNHKYDLRVYVVVTSADPLRVYMFKDGLVRFATSEYSTKQKDLKKRYIHLTNFSVNKEAPNQTQELKWTHREYREKLSSDGIDDKLLFKNIKDIVVKTCIAVEPLLLDPNGKYSEHRSNYFELYGFDILVDEHLKPWVLEVNVSPSLNSASALDYRVKTKLLCDMLHLVGIPCNRRFKLRFGSNKIADRNLNDIAAINGKNFRQKVGAEDLDVLISSLEEQLRRGDFSCLYPNPKTIHSYERYFEYQRYHNKLIQKYYSDGSNWQL